MIASRMLPLVRLIRNSDNRKTGNIPVSSTQSASCSPSCPFMVHGKPKCYGAAHFSGMQWVKLDTMTEAKGNVHEWYDFVSAIAKLPLYTLWRHDEYGDLPHHDGEIDTVAVAALVHANRRKAGFTYTHHKLNAHNLDVIRRANDGGFTVNISANTVAEAVAIMREHKLPVVCILPKNAPNVQKVDGVKVVACPHEKSPEKVKCANCRLCAIPDRACVIGFRPHSIYAGIAETIANGGAA